VKKVLAVAALALTAIAAGPTAGYAASGDCRVIRPATATTAAVSACRQDTWLHQGSSRYANTVAGSETPSWNTTKPTGASDSGGLYFGFRPYSVITGESSPQFQPTFTGTYTGVLDNIAATFYIASPIYQKTSTVPTNFYDLKIDGKTVWTNGSADDEIATPETMVDSNVGHIDFAFIGLYDALKAKGIANGATTKHTITLSFVNKYYGDGNFAMYFDSTDYPSGMAFNLEDDPLVAFIPMDATWQL